MVLLEILQTTLNLLCPIVNPDPSAPVCSPLAGVADSCPASALTAIAAAFATEGYWVHADVLAQLGGTVMSHWPILLYVCGVIGGLIGVALNMPPRNYMWFILGPCLYDWLIYTTVPVKGVAWMVANNPQMQSEVWRLAEPGLANTNMAAGINAEGDDAGITACAEPRSPVLVSFAFAYFDELVSSTVQWIVEWSGLNNLNGRSSGNSNLPNFNSNVGAEGKWFLLSNLKWNILDKITSARLNDLDLRDAFATFMASECGDAFAKSIDRGEFIRATESRGATLVEKSLGGYDDGNMVSVFRKDSPFGNQIDYTNPIMQLRTETIPTPISLKDFIANNPNGTGAFNQFSDYFKPTEGVAPMYAKGEFEESINCTYYLYILIQGFRWEAGHIYYNILNTVPYDPELRKSFTENLFYGWDLKTGGADGDGGQTLTPQQSHQFLINLILVHLIRNEFEAVAVGDGRQLSLRYTEGNDAGKAVERYQKSVGSKNKYGELYSWAMMVPYIQGILLYFLAIAYPFACMLIVVPGWHKTVLTWASFWAWVKLWDAGFAFVMALERTVWAMIGSSSDAAALNKLIIQMMEWGQVNVRCPDGSGSAATNLYQLAQSCGTPVVTNGPGIAAGFMTGSDFSGTTAGVITGGLQPLFYAFRVLDRGMSVSANLDLDLANGYYLYIMAALYLAVPGIVGQVVLGARSGVAGMVGQMFGGTAAEGGKQAGSGFLSDFTNKGKLNEGAQMESSFGKGMRQGGLAANALGAANSATEASMKGSALGSLDSMLGHQASAVRGTFGNIGANLDHAGKRLGVEQQQLGNLKSGTRNTTDMVTNAKGGTVAGKTGGTQPNAWSKWAGGVNAGLQTLGDGAAAAQTFQAGKNADAQRNATVAGNNAQFGFDKARAANSAAQFGEQAKSQLGNLHAGRMNSAANFEAQSAQWKTARAIGAQMSGSTGAMGVFANTFGAQAGQKPVSLEGMANRGQLGGAAQSAFGWAAPAGTAKDPLTGQLLNPGGGGTQMAAGFGSKVQAQADKVGSLYQSAGQPYFNGTWNSTPEIDKLQGSSQPGKGADMSGAFKAGTASGAVDGMLKDAGSNSYAPTGGKTPLDMLK